MEQGVNLLANFPLSSPFFLTTEIRGRPRISPLRKNRRGGRGSVHRLGERKKSEKGKREGKQTSLRKNVQKLALGLVTHPTSPMYASELLNLFKKIMTKPSLNVTRNFHFQLTIVRK